MKYLLLIALMPFSCAVLSQKGATVKIESARLYKEPGSVNHNHISAGSAYLWFDTLTTNKAPYIMLTNDDLTKLEKLLNDANIKKLKINIFTGTFLFCEIKFADQATSTFSRTVISLGEERAIIADLTAKRDYVVTAQEDLLWLNEFTRRIMNE